MIQQPGARQPTPVFLPGESPWTEEPCGNSPRDHKDSDMTEWLSTAQQDAAISLLGTHPDKIIIQKDTVHSYVHSSIIYNSQDREMTKISIDSWMNKKDVVHVYNGYYSVIKNEWNNAIFSNMDATRDDHTKWSKSEKTYHMTPLICGI